MRSAFLSYARSDRSKVQALANDLRSLGYQVWYDVDLPGGSEWWRRILAQIRSCEVFVFCISTDSVGSEACLAEHAYSQALRRTVLPVLVSAKVSSASLPPNISNLQLVDYQAADKGSLAMLARAAIELPASLTLPDPLPLEPGPPGSYVLDLREAIDTTDLSFDVQAGLAMRLKELFHGGRDRDEVIDLVMRLRLRRDVYLTVARELDTIVQAWEALTSIKSESSDGGGWEGHGAWG